VSFCCRVAKLAGILLKGRHDKKHKWKPKQILQTKRIAQFRQHIHKKTLIKSGLYPTGAVGYG